MNSSNHSSAGLDRRTFITRTALGICSMGFASHQAFAADAKKRVAVVYFTKTHNTESLAKRVSELTHGTAFRVDVVDPYPESYGPATEVVKEELEKGIVRAIKPLDINANDFDVFVLCTPTWWHHVAKPLETWIKSVDLSGKFVLTANTHGGGGRMNTREDFEALLTKSRLGTHLTHYGSVGAMNRDVSEWLKENGLI